MEVVNDSQLITVSDAARTLELSATMVRQIADRGQLPTLRTASGTRLFQRGDVERLAAQRAGRR